MRNRRLAKVATGLAVGVAALGLLSLPAAADTEDAEITSGTLDLYDEFFSLIDSVALGSSGGSSEPCSPGTGTITMTNASPPTSPSTGTWEANISTDTAVNIGGDFRVVLVAHIEGDFTGTALDGDPALSWASASVQPTTGAGSCTVEPGSAPCEIDAVNLDIDGVHTVVPTDDIQIGDTATVSGGNTPGNFETQVSGDPDDCGSLIALNNGGVFLNNVVVTAI